MSTETLPTTEQLIKTLITDFIQEKVAKGWAYRKDGYLEDLASYVYKIDVEQPNTSSFNITLRKIDL